MDGGGGLDRGRKPDPESVSICGTRRNDLFRADLTPFPTPMSYRTWSERLERLVRRARRQAVRRSVRAYRARQAREGIRRIDVALSREDFLALQRLMLDGETYSAAVSRAIAALSRNTRQSL